MRTAFGLFFIAALTAHAQLGPPVLDVNFTPPADWSWWVQTAGGTLAETANGLTTTGNGVLNYAGSAVAVGAYEIRTRYRLVGSGGSYTTNLEGSTDANLLANTGTFAAAELTNVQVNGGACSATLKIWQRTGGATSLLAQFGVACAQDYQLRFVVRNSECISIRTPTLY